jgi:hypothetical protein
MAVNGKRGVVFSKWSERYPHDATIEELLGEVFSVWSMLRLNNEEHLQLQESLDGS